MPPTPPEPPSASAQLTLLAQLFPQLQEAVKDLATPAWKFTETLPMLTKTNFDAWDGALRNVLLEHELSCLLDPSLDINTYAGDRKTFMEKACASCSRMIAARIDPKIFEIVPGSVFRETPFQIYHALQTLIKKDNSLMHSILKAEAVALKMTDDTTIEQYVEKHLSLRARMLTANYPEITEQKTTVKFMVDGLVNHPTFGTYVGGWYCYGLPNTVDELHQRMHACSEHHKKVEPTRTLPPAGGFKSPHNDKRDVTKQRHGSDRERPRRGRGRYGQSSVSKDIGKIAQYIAALQETQTRPKRNPKAKSAKTDHHDEHTIDDFLSADHDHQKQSGKYTLDSAAHPSHVNHPVPIMTKLSKRLTTLTATSASTSSTHKGLLKLKSNGGTNIHVPTLVNPDVSINLISAHQLCKQFGQILLSPDHGYVLKTKSEQKPLVVATADWRDGEYQLNVTNTHPQPSARSARTLPHEIPHPTIPIIASKNPTPIPLSPTPPNAVSDNAHQSVCNVEPITPQPPPTKLPESFPPHPPKSAKASVFHEWHLIFNHLDLKTLQTMAKQQLLPLPSILKQNPPKLTCTGCAHGKARPKPYKRTTHTYAIGVSISSDVCGPISPSSRHGNKYFVTFIDTASRYAILHFTATRKDVIHFIKATVNLIRNLHGTIPHIFTSDNAREYISTDATSFLQSQGITPRPTTPYSPQQIGIAERLNATLMQAARSTLFHSKLPAPYWEEALRDAVFKYNISLHSSAKKLPYTLWFGSPPSLTNLFPFGQKGTFHSSPTKAQKESSAHAVSRHVTCLP